MIESCSVSLFDCLTKIFTLWDFITLGKTCVLFSIFLGLSISGISMFLLYRIKKNKVTSNEYRGRSN